MRVTIAVPGKFHAFDIAEGLHKRGILDQIFTTYPRFAVSTTLPSRKVAPVRHPEFVMQAGQKLPGLDSALRWTGWNSPTERIKNRLFDRAVARQLRSPPDDAVFIGFAGCCLRSLRRANELGFTTAVERSSSHIRTQKEILDEEYRRHDVGPSPVSEQHVRREEQEYNEADYVMTPSEFAYQTFLDQGYDRPKVRYVPFGVDVPEPKSSYSVDKPLRVLFAGNVCLRKGPQYLLSAWDKLDLEDARLVFTSSISQNMEHIVREYRDRSDIRFLNWVEDLGQWYRRCDIFAFPSLEEGSAIVTYEAMAHGLPVVTTFNSGWVGEDGTHGREVPIRDVETLAAEIEKLSKSQYLRRRWGSMAHNLIKSEYNKERYKERIIRTYRKMIE